jgi:hypothetical protein
MTQFVRLAAYKTKSRRDGHTRELTAKLVGNRIVFAGGRRGQVGIEADADITDINNYWVTYCVLNDGAAAAGFPQINRAMIDAARGKAS